MKHRCYPDSVCIYGQRHRGQGPYLPSAYVGPCPCPCHLTEQDDTETPDSDAKDVRS